MRWLEASCYGWRKMETKPFNTYSWKKLANLSKILGRVSDFLWLVSKHATKPKGETQQFGQGCATLGTKRKSE